MGRKSPLGIKGTAVSFRDPNERGRMTSAMVRARDQEGAWKVKRFEVTSWHRDGSPIMPDEATEWAENTREDYIKGVATAGVASFQTFAALVAEDLASKGVTAGRLALLANVSKDLARVGVSDMQASTFPSRVRRWLNELEAGWSMAATAPNRRTQRVLLKPATKNKLLILLRQVTALAVQRGKLARDPLAELSHYEEEKRLKPVFSIVELRHMVSDEARDHAILAHRDLEAAIAAKGGLRGEAVLAIAKARKVHWSTVYNILKRPAQADPWYLPCCLLVYTGCRADEAMHLRWEWIRWEERRITLKLTGDYGNKSKSERLIPLEPELAAILQPLAKPAGHILAEEIRAGSSGMRQGVKRAKGGSRDYTNALRVYLHRIGIDAQDRTAHSLRHQYICLKIAHDGTNVDKLRKAVGHENEATTKGYSNLSQLFEAEVERWPDNSLWLRRPVPAIAATRDAQ